MSLKPIDWHNRFLQQAHWTRELREHLLNRVSVAKTETVLEVGCGSGVILGEIKQKYTANVVGVDINFNLLDIAITRVPSANFILGDANVLPLNDNSVDISVCHFFLLWVSDPLKALFEMLRVTKPGGAVLAMAEPDYGGRIDYPPELVELGKWQTKALQRQGAEPLMGRRLAEIFSTSGLSNIETGVLGGLWSNPPSECDWKMEWAVIEADLAGYVNLKELANYKKLDKTAWDQGTRILFVPTFYALGWVRN